MVQDKQWFKPSCPGGRALKQLVAFPARVFAGAHVNSGAGESRREFSQRGHFGPALQQPDHPFAISDIARLRFKEQYLIEYEAAPKEHGVTQGRSLTSPGMIFERRLHIEIISIFTV